MYLVTGATGALGRAIVRDLLARVPASQIAASVRDPDKAKDLTDAGVRVRRGDFADPSTLAHAFEGATQILIVSANSGDAVAQHRDAIAAAKAAGVARIVYTSQMGSNPTSPFSPMPNHAATEVLLRESGVPFVSLRNGFYAATAKALFSYAMQTGEIVAPADGPVAWTAHGDLAQAAAVAMTTDTFDGITPPLTVREAIDLSRVAEIMSELAGREVRRRVITDEEYLAMLVARGVPQDRAAMLVGMFAASRLGQFSMVGDTLARAIGREPLTLRDVLSER